MSKETAMSELRPWVNSKITVGTFKAKVDMVAIDLTADPYDSYLEDNSDEWREKVVWDDTNYGFSESVINTDVSAEYVPTQILAKFFKKNGFKAIIHKSSLGENKNIVFFKNECLELISKEVKQLHPKRSLFIS